MGVSPLWGFHAGGALLLAWLFKLNKPIAVLFSNISLPPFIPFVIYISHKIGGLWLGEHAVELNFNEGLTFDVVRDSLFQYVIGGFTLSLLLALVFGGLTFMFFSLRLKHSSKR